MDRPFRFRLLADPMGSTLDQESDLMAAHQGHNVNWLLPRGGGDRVRVF